MNTLEPRAAGDRLRNSIEQDPRLEERRAGKAPPRRLANHGSGTRKRRRNRTRLQIVGVVSVLALIAGLETAQAVPGECLDNRYRLCWGDCPQGTTDQNECTPRIEQTPPAKWCCCPDTYPPGGGEITPAPPSDSDASCEDVSIPGETDGTSTGRGEE